MVFYRKYRPQTISELDLALVREKLSAILSSKELPHAFLFTGPKGLGKTSSARILAKAINCVSPKGIEPCNKCEACVTITDGSNIDVLEIDAASNGGVEEMRTLRERVKFASSTLKKKVYIIDEVHMLSTGAFNALLKTLEEPPSHVVFVLATTELWKLPATVVSRTFQITFDKPTEEELVHSLKRVVSGEHLKVEEDVLEELYHLADGSFRDGTKLLEELAIASKGEEITVALLEETFKTKGVDSEVYELLSAYEKRDAKKALESIAHLSDAGADFKVVIERLVEHLRGLLMMRNGIESEEKDVHGLTISDIKKLLELANEAYGELKISVIPQLPLELISVKFCIIDAEQRTKDEKQGIGDRGQETEDTSQKTEDIRQKTLDRRQKTEDESSNETEMENKRAQKGGSPGSQELLPELIARLNVVNKPGAALLRSAKSAKIEGNEFVIITPFPIHAERLKSDKVFGDLQKIASEITDKKVAIAVRVAPKD